ncbi:MAG: hypothetical protein GXO89_01300, partial [Chlorobi bacterium]|nr:hypothetical protein [Chlorobiota bacterium]
MNDTLTICKPRLGTTIDGFQMQFKFIKNSVSKIDMSEFENSDIKVLSLFSGCGGLDLGILGDFEFRGKKYTKNRFKIVFSNDFDSAATKVYNENFKYFKHKISEKDIALISHREIP